MVHQRYMGRATRHLALPDPFPMRRGGELRGARIAYETWGELRADRSNALLILTGLSPGAHAASSDEDPAPGWWEDVVGPGKAVDTERFFVICVNSLGSCMGSTGPSSIRPTTGEAYRLDFPTLTLEDVAESARCVVKALGIQQLHALIGPSMGGMSALAYILMHGDESRNLVLSSTALRATPFAIAVRSLQRELIRSDPEWMGGGYSLDAQPLAGMRLARKVGMITYRSGEEWLQRFGRNQIPEESRSAEPFAMKFEIESYLESRAERFTGDFDANSYLYLSRALDLFDAAEHGDTAEEALTKIRAQRALVTGVTSDLLFPLWQQRDLARGLDRAGCQTQFAELSSIQGHDSFLVDTEPFGQVVGEFLRRTDRDDGNPA